MKAAVYRGGGQRVAIENVDVRTPGAGEVRVAIKAAGLCHSDQSVTDGTIPYPVPVVLGHEGAGVVESVGPGVTSVKPGDTVVLSTLAHCGRCPACEQAKPTLCRNAPNPKDTRPFTIGGETAYQFANTSTFAELTLVREQSAIPIDAQSRTGGDLGHAVEECLAGLIERAVSVHHVPLQLLQIDPKVASKKGGQEFHFGSEIQAVAVAIHIQGLFAKPVATEAHRLIARVVNGEGPHTFESIEYVPTKLCDGSNEHFRI